MTVQGKDPPRAAPTEGPGLELALSPSVNEVCEWLSSGQSLDDVAHQLRYLRMVHAELADVIGLLRQHVLSSMGERDIDPEPGRPLSHDVPF